MARKKINFVVTDLVTGIKSVPHEVGSIYRPLKWELRKTLYTINSKHPDCVQSKYMFLQLESVYSLEEDELNPSLAPYFPYVLDFFRSLDKLDTTDKVCTWILACYWYSYCGGPKPATKLERGTHKRVRTPRWKQDLFCPFCKSVSPKEVTGTEDRVEALRLFAEWIGKHSAKCSATLSVQKSKEQLLARSEYQTKLEQGYQRIERQYIDALKLEPVVKQQLRKMWLQNDRLMEERSRVKALQATQDSRTFELAVKKAEIATKEKLAPLSVKEQYRYRDLALQIARIEQLLNSIKGKKGLATERKTLQNDLKVRKNEFEQLERRRTYAGEE